MVFEVSWGETFILIGAATAIIGRKDLPRASRFLGAKMGRVVGFLQGARLRADQFASSNELTALQNELRSGLRELDTVKGELAIAASSRGLVGRGLGSTVGLGSGNGEQRYVNARSSSPHPTKAQGSIEGLSGHDYLDAARGQAENLSQASAPPKPLAPRFQSVAAVAEEEWVKQGIGFKSRIERTAQGGEYGSDILSNLIQQSLIHDQYDRAVQEEEQELNDRMERVKRSRQEK